MVRDDLTRELRDLAHELDPATRPPVRSIDPSNTPWPYPGRTSYRDAGRVTHVTISIDTEGRVA
jgi:hypothetical protein